METILAAVLPAVSSIAVACIGVMSARETKRRKVSEAKMEKRAELRAHESQLSMQLMSASVDLGIATALAVSQQKVNGEMDRAMKGAAETQKHYEDFLQQVTAAQLSK